MTLECRASQAPPNPTQAFKPSDYLMLLILRADHCCSPHVRSYAKHRSCSLIRHACEKLRFMAHRALTTGPSQQSKNQSPLHAQYIGHGITNACPARLFTLTTRMVVAVPVPLGPARHISPPLADLLKFPDGFRRFLNRSDKGIIPFILHA